MLKKLFANERYSLRETIALERKAIGGNVSAYEELTAIFCEKKLGPSIPNLDYILHQISKIAKSNSSLRDRAVYFICGIAQDPQHPLNIQAVSTLQSVGKFFIKENISPVLVNRIKSTLEHIARQDGRIGTEARFAIRHLTASLEKITDDPASRNEPS